MSTGEIKIFYSWQSDLPGNQTRNLIQNGIDAAVKALKDTVEIDADRDTKGVLGTPDITETIFNKIAESDIFVADISIINKYSAYDNEGNKTDEVKCSPNPNVLLELGFAASILGWENVICIMNTDFGRIEDLPFDLSHRRPFCYSLAETDKANAKREIRSVIMSAVANVIENGPRAKAGYSNLILGGYDFSNNSVNIQRIPYQCVLNLPGYQAIKNSLKEKGIELIKTILSYPAFVRDNNIQGKETIIDSNGVTFTQDLFDLMREPKFVTISEEDRQETTNEIKEFFSVDVPEVFFDFGNLKRKDTLIPHNTEYIGCDEEKNKYADYDELQSIISQISLLRVFAGTFEGMMVIPLCIINNSAQFDEEITVSIQINDGIGIQPSCTLFNKEFIGSGLEEYVYENGMIKEIFFLPEDSIQYDNDISYDIQDSIRESQRVTQRAISGKTFVATLDDYGYEIKKYIASSQERSTNTLYVFEISKLRPQEKKWLGPLLLVKPSAENRISISYTIKSTHSSGLIEGTLSMECLT